MSLYTTNDKFIWDDENPDLELVEPKILVSINKNMLKFGRAIGRPPVAHEIMLVNHGDHPVAFKVQTTDNVAYFVNQVYGVIPGRRLHAMPSIREQNSFSLVVNRVPHDSLPQEHQRLYSTPHKNKLFILLAPIFHHTAAPASVFHIGASYEKLRVCLHYTGTDATVGDVAYLYRRSSGWCTWSLESTEKKKIQDEERTVAIEDSQTLHSRTVTKKDGKKIELTQHTSSKTQYSEAEVKMKTPHALPSAKN